MVVCLPEAVGFELIFLVEFDDGFEALFFAIAGEVGCLWVFGVDGFELSLREDHVPLSYVVQVGGIDAVE